MANNLPPLTGDITRDLPPLSGDIAKDLGPAPESVRAAPPAAPPTAGLDPGVLAAKSIPGLGGALGVLVTPGGAKAARDTARTTIPAAVGAATGGLSLPLQAAAQAGTTYAMQQTGLEKPSWFQVLLSGGLPFLGAGVGRLLRGGERTATRMVPSRFEREQGKAAQAAGQMVEQMKPKAPASVLARAAGQASEEVIGTREVAKQVPSSILTPQGTPAMRTVTSTVEMRPTIAVPATEKLARGLVLPAKSANPQMESVRTTIENIKAAADRGAIQVKDLEAIRQDIGPLVGRSGAPPKLKALYGAMIQDLESAARTGEPSALLARASADSFKRELGAATLADLITKASPQRVISGATVPALNVATLNKLIHVKETREALTKQLGPQALKVVDRFIHDFRALPPDVAFNGWNRMILTLGGVGGGAGVGSVLGGIPGAVIGALAPEVLTNMALVGRNPAALNALMTTLAAGTRGATVSAPAMPGTTRERTQQMREITR